MPGPLELTNTQLALRCCWDPVARFADVEEAHGARARWPFTAVSKHPFLNREDPGVAAGLRPLERRRMLADLVEAASAHEVPALQPAMGAP